jgi:hypothetical protein
MQCNRKIALVLFLVLSLVSSSAAKPRVTVAPDGFPTGQDTPEGAASDLARVFMSGDAQRFRGVCIRPYGGGPARADYMAYLEGISDHLNQKQGNPSPDNPKRIVTVFAARHLTKNGPASYGYAAFEFQEVMFVDVQVELQNGSIHLRRTMVIKDRDGKWYVHPVPDVSPLLSYGLYDESASVQRFTDVYDTPSAEKGGEPHHEVTRK